jgi:hypothetical protein
MTLEGLGFCPFLLLLFAFQKEKWIAAALCVCAAHLSLSELRKTQ